MSTDINISISLSMAIPLTAFFFYCVLFLLALKSPRSKVARIFIGYLVVMIIWSFGSFAMRADIFPGTLVWNRIMIFGMMGVPFLFFHFSQEILGRAKLIIWRRIGYVFWGVLFIGNLLGMIVADAYMSQGTFVYILGPLAVPFGIIGGGYTLASAIFLINEAFRNPPSFWSNRLVYPSIGAAVITLGSLLNFIPRIGQYPIDIAANTVNACLLYYAIYRYHFLNITITIRKGLVYSVLTALLTGSYLLIVFVAEHLIREQVGYSTILFALPVAVIIALFFEPAKKYLQLLIDKFFFGQQFGFRETLKEFSHIITAILDLDKLANSTLELLTKALQTSSCYLFLPDRDGNFYIHSAYGAKMEDLSAIRMDKTSPIVCCLSQKSESILTIEEIETRPDFQGLWQSERDELEEMKAELLVGIRMHKELLGILVLSEKTSGDPYSDDDRELLLTLSNEAAVAINNARAYTEARTQAVRDELTKLFNYRFFHEFLDKEIARCKRADLPCSVIFMDLDLFKVYNDLYGHLVGDEALNTIAKAINESTRATDVAARYGGDEFAIILPATNPLEAVSVAERIRNRVQNNFRGAGYDSKLLTVSLGVASYPKHAGNKQQLLYCADQALYQAKRLGRNKVCLYTPAANTKNISNVVTENTLEAETDFLRKQIEDAYLSTVYTLAAVINARDNYTYTHSKMVTAYALALAQALKLSEERKEMVRLASMLHDIGKIGIPEYILNKPGPLTPSEREIVQRHSNIAEAIINQMPYLRRVAPIILHHHESFDGSGYPNGIKGKNIPIESRILTIADVYHALTSDRPYRKAMAMEEAISQLQLLSGKKFDPDLVPVFIRLLKNEMIEFQYFLKTVVR